MRHLAATAAALGVLALALTPALAQDGARLLRMDQLSAPAPGEGPVILRGAAIAPKPAVAARPSAPSWQITAGRRLWLVDPVTEDVRACTVRNTTTVGVQELNCVSGTLGRYSRTFGPTFQP